MRLATYTSALILALGLAGTALGQQSPAEGNWACWANIDNTKSGLLTVYANSYGYASRNYESSASGAGNAQLATDGVTFLDGNLVSGAGITFAIASLDQVGQSVLTLYQPQPDGAAAKPILTCWELYSAV